MDFKHDILPLKDRLFRIALRVTMNREEAEDVVQDVLLRLWQKRDELSAVSSLEAFALKMAYNKALDSRSKASNKNLSLMEEIHDRPDDRNASPYETLARKEQMSRIEAVINAMPEKQRSVIQLRDIEGKTYKEIADILAITEADVKVTLFRARKTLKEKILNSPPTP